MKEYKCPSCGSDSVAVGNFVLSCYACGWHYLNEYQCSRCGKPSQSVVHTNGKTVYGCNEHSASRQLGINLQECAEEISQSGGPAIVAIPFATLPTGNFINGPVFKVGVPCPVIKDGSDGQERHA